MRATPTLPMKVLLNLTPHIYIQRETMSAAYKLIQSQSTSITQFQGIIHQKLIKELKSREVTCLTAVKIQSIKDAKP